MNYEERWKRGEPVDRLLLDMTSAYDITPASTYSTKRLSAEADLEGLRLLSEMPYWKYTVTETTNDWGQTVYEHTFTWDLKPGQAPADGGQQ